MAHVNANAIGNPYHHSSGDSDPSTSTSVVQGTGRLSAPPVRRLVLVMLGAAAVSLAVGLRAPLTVTVLGLLLFGVLHNVLEIRYVAGRFASLLTGRFLILLLILTSGIALCRLTAQLWQDVARYVEIGIGYLILLSLKPKRVDPDSA